MRQSAFPQVTLARPIAIEGVGIHSGQVTRLTLRPAAPDAGVRFLRSDVKDRDPAVTARVEAVCQTRLGTVIGNGDGVTVSTIEHLMAALCGLGVDNVLVEIDGPEVPIIDGALSWVACTLRELIAGGDHTIAIGEVVAMGLGGGDPLLWYAGRYHDVGLVAER